VRVDPTGLAQSHLLADQALQPSPFGQVQDRCEPGARHEVRVIEDGGDSVRDSHLRDALLLRSN